MSAADQTGWHGWVSGQQALFLQKDSEDGYVKIFIQQDRSVAALATLHSDEAGQLLMQWLDETLTEQAEIHAELLKRLENEQPLLFASTGAPDVVPETEDAIDLDEED